MTALNADVVIVPTGRLPNMEVFEQHDDQPHAVSSWGTISGDEKPAGNFLIYDECGDHPALQAAGIAAKAGASVETMTPHRILSADGMAMNLVPYMRSFQDMDATFTVTRHREGISRSGNKLIATIGAEHIEL